MTTAPVKKIVLLLGFILSGAGRIEAQDLFFERVYDESLAQTSYMVGSTLSKEAIVIDPKRDIDTYLDIAEAKGLKITQVTETHIHADFLSGSREVASATGAKLLLSAEGGKDWQYAFPHTPLQEGDTIRVGKLILEVIHTPGHTPESLSFLLSDPDQANAPRKAITGDFIFVGDVGRPDLLEKAAGQAGTQEAAARQLYASLRKFSALPGATEIWPGHGAGSFCGKSLSAIPHSTLQQEKAQNKAFQFANDESGFVKYILEGQPDPPRYFAMMKRLNKTGRPLQVEIPPYPRLTTADFIRAQQHHLPVIDTRSRAQVAKGFYPGSLHIEDNKSFSTWMGSLLNYEQQFVLVAEADQVEGLSRKLMRIGMDNVYGYIPAAELPAGQLEKADIINIDQFASLRQEAGVQVIDLRSEKEYAEGHIAGAKNISLMRLLDNLDQISRDKPVVLHCQAGPRAAIAYSLLRKYGFNQVQNFAGGFSEWQQQNRPVVK